MTGFSFAGQWYIEPGYADRMKEMIVPRLEAGKDPLPPSMFQGNPPIDARLSRNEQYMADYFRTQEGVGLLPVKGAMSRNGEMCSYGNETLMNWMGIMARDEQTRAIVMNTNSPGGTVDSTRGFADKVREVSAIKPVVMWTPFAASAAYFVGSQATEIMVEDQLVGGIGSIGVLMVLTNQKAALEKQGIQVEILRADGSQDKALVNGVEPISEQTRAELQATLNACRAEFVGYVRRGRAGKLTSNEVFTGKMYTASDAVRLGLADRKGSLQQAIQRALQLSK
jgi:protease-4